MRILATLLAASLAAPASAASLADIDLTSLSFDRLTNSAPGATGTSNGIGWSMNVTGFGPFTGQNTYDIDGGAYTFDDLHIGDDFSITFDEPITTLLFFAENDNPSSVRRSGIDLGFPASDFGTFENDGTAYIVSNVAGFILYEFSAPTTTITTVSVTDIAEGFDVSFFANPIPAAQIPLPATGLLLLAALGGGSAVLRRR